MTFGGILNWFANAWSWISSLHDGFVKFVKQFIIGRFLFLVTIATSIFVGVIWGIVKIVELLRDAFGKLSEVLASGGADGPQVLNIFGNVCYVLCSESFLAALAVNMAVIVAVLSYRFVKSWIPTVAS